MDSLRQVRLIEQKNSPKLEKLNLALATSPITAPTGNQLSVFSYQPSALNPTHTSPSEKLTPILEMDFPGMSDDAYAAARLLRSFIVRLCGKLLENDWNIYTMQKPAGPLFLPSNKVTIPSFEAVFNAIKHGGGGDAKVYHAEEPNGTKTLKIIIKDNGPGIKDAIQLLENSIKASNSSMREGRGYHHIVRFPDKATIESKGKRWIKVIGAKPELLLDDKPSEINEGTKITFEWYYNDAFPAGQTPENLTDPTPDTSPDKPRSSPAGKGNDAIPDTAMGPNKVKQSHSNTTADNGAARTPRHGPLAGTTIAMYTVNDYSEEARGSERQMLAWLGKQGASIYSIKKDRLPVFVTSSSDLIIYKSQLEYCISPVLCANMVQRGIIQSYGENGGRHKKWKWLINELDEEYLQEKLFADSEIDAIFRLWHGTNTYKALQEFLGPPRDGELIEIALTGGFAENCLSIIAFHLINLTKIGYSFRLIYNFDAMEGFSGEHLLAEIWDKLQSEGIPYSLFVDGVKQPSLVDPEHAIFIFDYYSSTDFLEKHFLEVSKQLRSSPSEAREAREQFRKFFGDSEESVRGFLGMRSKDVITSYKIRRIVPSFSLGPHGPTRPIHKHTVFINNENKPRVFYTKHYTYGSHVPIILIENEWLSLPIPFFGKIINRFIINWEFENEAKFANIAHQLGLAPKTGLIRIGKNNFLIQNLARGNALHAPKGSTLEFSLPKNAGEAKALAYKIGQAIGILHNIRPQIIHSNISEKHIFWEKTEDGDISVQFIDFGHVNDLSAREERNKVSKRIPDFLATFLDIPIQEVIDSFMDGYYDASTDGLRSSPVLQAISPAKVCNNRPVAVSLAADLKLTEDGIKILEMCPVNYAGFEGFRRLYGKDMQNDIIYPYLRRKLKTRVFKDFLVACDAYSHFLSTLAWRLLGIYTGIVVWQFSSSEEMVNNILFRFPSLIILNDRIKDQLDNKAVMLDIFEGHEDLLPKTLVYPAAYVSGMTEEILSQLKTDSVVIKPLTQNRGEGAIVLKREELDEVLRKVFGQPRKNIGWRYYDESFKRRFADRQEPIAFWVDARQFLTSYESAFIVQERIASLPIDVDGKKYDGTIRVAFTIVQHRGKTNIKFHGGYWKLPVHSFDEGTLHSQTISHIDANGDRVCSARVNREDMKLVRDAFHPILPEITRKIRDLGSEALLRRYLFSEDKIEVLIGLQLFDTNYLHDYLRRKIPPYIFERFHELTSPEYVYSHPILAALIKDHYIHFFFNHVEQLDIVNGILKSLEESPDPEIQLIASRKIRTSPAAEGDREAKGAEIERLARGLMEIIDDRMLVFYIKELLGGDSTDFRTFVRMRKSIARVIDRNFWLGHIIEENLHSFADSLWGIEANPEYKDLYVRVYLDKSEKPYFEAFDQFYIAYLSLLAALSEANDHTRSSPVEGGDELGRLIAANLQKLEKIETSRRNFLKALGTAATFPGKAAVSPAVIGTPDMAKLAKYIELATPIFDYTFGTAILAEHVKGAVTEDLQTCRDLGTLTDTSELVKLLLSDKKNLSTHMSQFDRNIDMLKSFLVGDANENERKKVERVTGSLKHNCALEYAMAEQREGRPIKGGIEDIIKKFDETFSRDLQIKAQLIMLQRDKNMIEEMIGEVVGPTINALRAFMGRMKRSKARQLARDKAQEEKEIAGKEMEAEEPATEEPKPEKMPALREELLEEYTHFTTLEQAKLIFEYGFYGRIRRSGANFSIGTGSLKTNGRSWKDGIEEDGGIPVIIVFNAPRSLFEKVRWIKDKTPRWACLSDEAKVDKIPDELLGELRKIKATGMGLCDVARSLEGDSANDRLGHIPARFVDLEATIARNKQFFGDSFEDSEFAGYLSQKQLPSATEPDSNREAHSSPMTAELQAKVEAAAASLEKASKLILDLFGNDRTQIPRYIENTIFEVGELLELLYNTAQMVSRPGKELTLFSRTELCEDIDGRLTELEALSDLMEEDGDVEPGVRTVLMDSNGPLQELIEDLEALHEYLWPVVNSETDPEQDTDIDRSSPATEPLPQPIVPQMEDVGIAVTHHSRVVPGA